MSAYRNNIYSVLILLDFLSQVLLGLGDKVDETEIEQE